MVEDKVVAFHYNLLVSVRNIAMSRVVCTLLVSVPLSGLLYMKSELSENTAN